MIISVYNIKRSGKSIYVEFTANEKDFSIIESGYAKGKYVLAGDIQWDKDEFSDEENEFDDDINFDIDFEGCNNNNKSFDFHRNKSKKNFKGKINQNKNKEDDCEFEINDIDENYKPNFMQIKSKKFFGKFLKMEINDKKEK